MTIHEKKVDSIKVLFNSLIVKGEFQFIPEQAVVNTENIYLKSSRGKNLIDPCLDFDVKSFHGTKLEVP